MFFIASWLNIYLIQFDNVLEITIWHYKLNNAYKWIYVNYCVSAIAVDINFLFFPICKNIFDKHILN